MITEEEMRLDKQLETRACLYVIEGYFAQILRADVKGDVQHLITDHQAPQIQYL